MTVAVVGCGGGGGGSKGGSSTGTTGSTVPGSSVSVNLPSSSGLLTTLFLSGAGRATGDLVATIRGFAVTDTEATINNSGAGEVAVDLNEFGSADSIMTVPFIGENSRLFTTYTASFAKFNFVGTTGDITAPAAASFISRIRVFPGRETTFQEFLENDMFTTDGSTVSFDTDLFKSKNFSTGSDGTGTPALRSFINDYVSFDLSGLAAADRPLLSSGSPATRFFISGDNYALGDASNVFEILTETSDRFSGTYGPEGSSATPLGNSYHPGTFTILRNNPSDPDPVSLAKILALAGSWRSSSEVLSGMGSYEMITFPTSNDNEHQELIFGQFNAGQPVRLYFGVLNTDVPYTDGSHTFRGSFELHPVGTIGDPTNFEGTLEGGIDDFKAASGSTTANAASIRSGHYFFKSGTTFPASGFPTSGTFVVFRK